MADEERNDRCETCRFYQPPRDGLPDGTEGECRRFPPSVSPTKQHIDEAATITGTDGFWFGWWPEVPDHGWCGEYQPKQS